MNFVTSFWISFFGELVLNLVVEKSAGGGSFELCQFKGGNSLLAFQRILVYVSNNVWDVLFPAEAVVFLGPPAFLCISGRSVRGRAYRLLSFLWMELLVFRP